MDNKPTTIVIDINKLDQWIKKDFVSEFSYGYSRLQEVLLSGALSPDPIPPTIKPGDKVRHEELGDGIVFALDKEDQEITIVDFDNEGLMHIYCADLEVSHD